MTAKGSRRYVSDGSYGLPYFRTKSARKGFGHAVFRLEQTHPDYGAMRRRMVVVKYRGTDFRSGYHDYKIVRGGLRVFPRLVAAEHAAEEQNTDSQQNVVA